MTTFLRQRTPRILVVGVLASGLFLCRSLTQSGDASVRVFGYVTNVSRGVPVQGLRVDLQDDVQRLASATTDANGYYEIPVPKRSSYVFNLGVWARIGDYQEPRYIPDSGRIQPGDAAEVRFDIGLRPAGNLVLNVYNNEGSLVRYGEFSPLTRDTVYVTDLADLPQYGNYKFVHDQYGMQNGAPTALAIPALNTPAGSLNRAHVLWEVPGFGKVILDVDNEGKGYAVAEQEGHLVLNFNYEAAKSALAALRRYYDAFRVGGYTISPGVADGIEAAADRLRTAEGHLNKRPSALAEAVAELNLSLNSALWAQEQLHLEKARADIQKNRTGTVRLRVLDAGGQAVAGATVSFRQTARDFLFGANPMGNSNQYDERYAALLRQAGINYSYIISAWESIEPSPGKFDFGFIDSYQAIQSQLRQGFGLMGGLVFWLNRSINGTLWCPAYQDRMTFPELQANVSNHMQALAGRYRGRIDLWQINEQNLEWGNALGLTWDQKIDLYRSAIAGLRAGNPVAKVIFTSTALPYEFKPGKLERTDVRAGTIAFPEFLRLLDARGIGVDAIGLEFYYSGVINDGHANPGLSLMQISALLDLYDSFGKPVFINELSAPSAQDAGAMWWHRPWDEATQAEYLQAVYTVAFGKRMVKEIGWSFGVSDQDAFVRSGGLLDRNLKPKASYYALKNLVQSWSTNGEGQTESNGEFILQGFAGTYDVTVRTPNGATGRITLRIGERSEDEAEVVISENPV